MNKTFKISQRLQLPITPGLVEFVPQNATDFENHKNLIEQVGIAVERKLPLLLIGETGTGKTSLIRYLAKETNNGFRRVNHSGGTTVDDIKGKILIDEKGTYWVDGVLVEAMRKGWWYLADEINACSPEILFVYNSLLDDDSFIVLEENKGEVVKPHENFRFFASMNPSQDYAGTKELNKALLSRFVVIKTDFSPPAVEQRILTKRTGIKPEVAEKMIKFASEIRVNKNKEKISFVLSTRDLIMWANMFLVYRKYMQSAEITILNKVPNEDLPSIKDLLALHFKNIDNPTSKTTKSKQEGTIEEMFARLKIGMKVKTNGDNDSVSAEPFTATIVSKYSDSIIVKKDNLNPGEVPNWTISSANGEATIEIL